MCFEDDSRGDVFRLRISSRSDIKSKSNGAGFAVSRLIRVFLISVLFTFVLLMYEDGYTLPSSPASFVIFTGGGSNLSYLRTGPENPKSVLFRTKLAVKGLDVEDVNVDEPNLKIMQVYVIFSV